MTVARYCLGHSSERTLCSFPSVGRWKVSACVRVYDKLPEDTGKGKLPGEEKLTAGMSKDGEPSLALEAEPLQHQERRHLPCAFIGGNLV